MKKTILILALLFSYCISAQTIVQLGGNQKIETFEFNDTSNILTLKLENSGIKTVDLSSLSGGGSGSDNQTITDLSLSGTVLSITIEDGNTQTLDLAPILADGSETKISAGSNVTITGSGTTASPYVINSTGGGGGSTTIVDNLESTATDEALSANMGRDLKSQIDAIVSGSGNPNIIVANTLAEITAAGVGAIVEIRSDITLTADYEVSEGQTLIFSTGSIDLGEHKLTGNNTRLVVNGNNLAIDTFYGEVDGTFMLPNLVTVKNFGAKGIGKIIYDANITSGQNTVTSATANFTNDDIGKTIAIVGAVTGGKVLNTKITSITNSTTAIVEDSATLTVSEANTVVCYDDWNALNNTLYLFNQSGVKLDFTDNTYYHSTKVPEAFNRDDATNLAIRGADKTIEFTNNAGLQLIPHDLAQTDVLVIEKSLNVTIINLKLNGDRELHGEEGIGKTEGNYGLVSRSQTKNTRLINPTLSNFYGDGYVAKGDLQFSNYIDGVDNVSASTASEVAVGGISDVDGSVDLSDTEHIYTESALDLDTPNFDKQLLYNSYNYYKLSGRSFSGWGGLRTPYYRAYYYDESETTLLYASPLQHIYDEIPIQEEWKKVKFVFDLPDDIDAIQLMAAPQIVADGLLIQGGEIFGNGRDGISNQPDNTIIDGVKFYRNGYLAAGPGADINSEDRRRGARNLTIQNCTFRDSYIAISLVGAENVTISNNIILPNTRDLSSAPTNYPHSGISAAQGRNVTITGNKIYNRSNSVDRGDLFTNNILKGGMLTYSANSNVISNNELIDVVFKASESPSANRVGYPTIIKDNKIRYTYSIGVNQYIKDVNRYGSFVDNEFRFNDISYFSYSATEKDIIYFGENTGDYIFNNLPMTEDFGGVFEGNKFYGAKPSLATRDQSTGNSFFPMNGFNNNYIGTSVEFLNDFEDNYTIKNNKINGYVDFRLDNFPSSAPLENKTVRAEELIINIGDSYNWTNTGAALLKTNAKYFDLEVIDSELNLDVASGVTGASNRYLNLKHKGTTLFKNVKFYSKTAKTIDFTNTLIFPSDLGSITLINPKTDGITFVLRPQDKIIYTELENDLTDLQDGYVQAWDATDGVWKSVAQSSGGGSATTDASDLTSGVLADARVQESNVTQHESAIEITTSQITDYVEPTGLDKTQDLILDKSTNTSPKLGIENTFGGNDYQGYFSLTNANTYFYWGQKTNLNALLYGATNITPSTTELLSLGSIGKKFKDGWFSGSITSGGFKTTSGSAEILLGDGSTTPNTFLSKPTINQYNISRTAALAQANGTVNFTSGGDLTYTIDSGTFEVGTRILVNNEGATSVTITAGASVTVTGKTVLTAGQYTWLVQVSVDEWLAL